MEVRIGVQHANREITLESDQSSDQVQEIVNKAVAGDDPLLVLVDERGRRVVVPADKVAFVEIGEEASRRVGFNAASA
ncbi:MAG: DUF3107 domain-containing protein [Nocardioidaceae bacterium]